MPQQEGGAYGPLQAQVEASAGLCGSKEGGGMKKCPGSKNIVGCLENILLYIEYLYVMPQVFGNIFVTYYLTL